MMEIFITIYEKILYQPLFNLLVLLYQYLPIQDFGLAVIVLTVLVRFLLYPFITQSIRSQKILNQLQPKIQEIQKKYKDKETQIRETMALYRKEKVNPFSGIFLLLIQFPVLVALFQVFWKGLQPQSMEILYSFVPNPGTINPTFLGLINLGKINLFLVILTGILQFFQSKMMSPNTPKQNSTQMSQFSNLIQKQTLYFFPIFTILVLLRLPSAIALYWCVTTLFSIGQQYLILKHETRKP